MLLDYIATTCSSVTNTDVKQHFEFSKTLTYFMMFKMQ